MNKFIFRWLVANHFGDDLRCDTEEVATGACSSGRNEDCPGKKVRCMVAFSHVDKFRLQCPQSEVLPAA